MSALLEPEPIRPGTRILVAARNLYFGAGGMERTAVNLVNHLLERGLEVGVAYRAMEGAEPLYPLAWGAIHLAGPFTPDWLYESAIAFQPDVMIYLYATWQEAREAAALADTGIPLVLHEGTNPHRAINNNWAVARNIPPEQAADERLAMMSMCTRVRFTIPDYRDSLPEPLRSDSVGFPNAFVAADPEDIALRATEKRKIFVNIGGLKAVKNVFAAVEAFGMIADRIPDWDFHIFSARPNNTTTYEQIEAFCAERGLTGRIRVFPPTRAIGREYGRSQVHIIASKEEGLPNCVAEASRHGLPSIGFACCPGTNSLIVHERNGLLARCGEGEIEDLAAQMLRLATNDAEREAFGRAAFEESVMFDPDTIFRHWRQVIADAAADRPGRPALLERHWPDPEDRRKIRNLQRAVFGSRALPAPAATNRDDQPGLLSFVVPIYNKEAYLAETLCSIRDSVHPRKEVLLVDDCSTDSSRQIAEEFAGLDGWRLIDHSVNQGLSAARNTGLAAATGDYIQFWDADDVYHPTGGAEIVAVMERDGSDIGTGLAQRGGAVLEHYKDSLTECECTTWRRAAKLFSTASVCFKIYRRDFLHDNNLTFRSGLYMQDSEFNLRAFPLAERISASCHALGEYRRVEDSGARTYKPARYESALMIEDLSRAFYREHMLTDLEALRQEHVLKTVWPSFVRRATRDHHEIDAKTPTDAIDVDFLDLLRNRLDYMESGLLSTKTPNFGLHLGLYSIREGYYAWLAPLIQRRTPLNFQPDFLARNPKERALINKLTAQLRR